MNNVRINAARRNRSHAAFTSRDALITIFVVLLVAQLLATALIDARESARRASCNDKLRRHGTALGYYHSTFNVLPPATIWLADHKASPRDVEVGVTSANWIVHLLPYLEHRHLSESYVWQCDISNDANRVFRNKQIDVFRCPSDEFNRPDNSYVREYAQGKQAINKSYARGNYAINGGSQARCRYPGHAGMPCASGYHKKNLTGDTSQVWGNGVAGFNLSFSYGDFTNGLSHIVVLDEIRAGLSPIDPRGVWSVGQIGMSITWAHGIHGDAVGPNNPTVDSDDIHGCNTLGLVVGIDRLVSERMGCCDHCTGGNEQAGARSMHPGGVNVLMCDGSVGFVTDEVDQSIWHVMHSRENPQDFILPF